MSERNGLPRADWNMPPGVSAGSIPGNEHEWRKSFTRYSAEDCLGDAAKWLHENPDLLVRAMEYQDNGNNPVLVLEGVFS